jgi:hypothetical protein
MLWVLVRLPGFVRAFEGIVFEGRYVVNGSDLKGRN